jgi:signal transduction histidine kinase
VYRALIRSADPTVRPLALQRLARTEAKAGRREEALRLYAILEREAGAMIGDLPADLVGSVQHCELIAASETPASLASAASAFYRSLTGGRWQLEKARYLYYSEHAREWLAGAAAADRQAIDDLEAMERQKIRLSDAVGAVRSSDLRGAGHRLFALGGGHYLAFWRAADPEPGAVLVLLGESSLRSRVWPAILRAAASDEVAASLVAPDGAIVFATSAASVTAGAPMFSEQSFQDGDFLWRVRATPVRPDALYAEVARRRWLYLAMLVVMVGGLLAAGLVVGRTLRREVEVARLKSQFVAAVSHEFRSPLTGISQLSELLVGGKVTDETRRKEYYELIHRESQRLSRLVEQVLDFARMDEGRKQYRFERVDTCGWLRGVADDFQRTSAAQARTIAVSAPDGLPPLWVDPQAMAGAVHNLLDNAVKYSPNGGEVVLDVSATADGSGVAIGIRDEGVGIPPDEQQHLFERFFRGRQLADTVAGTGLGLSLVKQVVSAHGGEISVASMPGVGTTFTVVLPVERGR